MAEAKECPFCGEEILVIAKKCKHCGEWLDKTENEPQICKEPLEEEKSTVGQINKNKNGEKQSIGKIIGKIILGIVAIYLAICLWSWVGTVAFLIILAILLFIYFIGTKTFAWILGIISVVIFIATLSFHFLPERLIVFPKSSLTFSNTFIFEKDINDLIKRYNNASFLERRSIDQEPLVRKLKEKGIIHEEK